MSYIDTFDHEFVGFFGGLPLYHPLETVDGSGVPGEFSCSPSHLVLGGGDGEHPAIVLVRPGDAVLNYFKFWLHVHKITEASLTESALAMLNAAHPSEACVAYMGWDLETYAGFYTRCTAPCYPMPYRHEVFDSVDDWVVGSLGEFIYFSMPMLIPSSMAGTAAEVGTVVDAPILYNVAVPPPGFRVVVGRYKRPDGSVVWGNYRWTQHGEPRRGDQTGDQ